MSLIFFILGAVIGSTLACFNDRRNELKSFILGRSRCKNCKKTIKPLENIPILSYIFLKGRCSNCGEKINVSNFIYETLLAVLFLLAYKKYGMTKELIIVIIQIIFMASIAISDFFKMEVYSIDIIILLSVSLFNLNEKNILIPLFISILFAGIYYAFYKLGYMGDADIYLGFISGLYVKDLFGGFEIFRNSFVLAAFYGILSIVLLKKKKDDKIPFCPFIILAILLEIL